jgi:hypothetical protein
MVLSVGGVFVVTVGEVAQEFGLDREHMVRVVASGLALMVHFFCVPTVVELGSATTAREVDDELGPRGVGPMETLQVRQFLSFLSVSRFRCAVRPMAGEVVEKTASFHEAAFS